MKKAVIIFAILFAATLLIPLISQSAEKKENKKDELVTIFSSSVSVAVYPLELSVDLG